MRGIDVSSHDGFDGSRFKANTETAYQQSDFVIVKATQGTGYVFSMCDAIYQRAKRDGKLRGFYHYAGGNDPRSEAEYFVKHTEGYFGDGIPVLDFERIQNKAWGNAGWARQFVDRVHELTGVWCMVYIMASGISQVASCASSCALWVAGYPDNRNSWDVPNFRYSISPWQAWTLWQYTSSDEQTDRNVAQVDRDGWGRIAMGDRQPEHVKPPLPDALRGFSDLDSEAWYVEDVKACVERGWLRGFPDGTFGPDAAITRGQLCVALANAEGVKFEHTYSDVNPQPYYYDAVEWATGKGYVAGFPDGTFGPDAACTRAQMAVVLWHRAGSPAPKGHPTGMPDWGSVPEWAQDGVAWAVEGGVVGSTGQIRPDDACSRAEACAMLVRAIK